MMRAILRYINWTCRPEPSSPVPMYEVECTTLGCDARGLCCEDFENARNFMFAHVAKNPSHTGYREIGTRYWRMTGEELDGVPLPTAPRATD